MNINKKNILKVLVITSISTLLACGGSGGGDGSSSSSSSSSGGDTFFNSPVKINNSEFTNSAVGDFNNDGREDLVVTFHGSDPDSDNDQTVGNGWTKIPIKIYLQDANGNLVESTSTLINTVPSIALARYIEVADFNNDNYDDIYFGNHGLELGNPDAAKWYEKDVLLLSDGAGKYTDVMSTNMPTLSIGGRTNTHEWYTHGVDSADIDADGDIDLVINTVWSGTHVFTNTGVNSGSFTLKSTYSQANLWVAFIDADGVNGPDLFIGDAIDYLMAGRHVILKNDNTGMFSAGTIELPDPKITSVHNSLIEEAHAVDIDGDSDIDLIIGNSTASSGTSSLDEHIVQVLVNNGDSTFTDATTTRLPSPVNLKNWDPRFYVRDFNNDTFPDLLIVKKMNVSPYTAEAGMYVNANPILTRVTTLANISHAITPIKLVGDNNIDIVTSGSVEVSAGNWQNGMFIIKAKTALSN